MFPRSLVAAALSAVLALPAAALDRVTVTVRGMANEDRRERLTARLEAASLSRVVLEEGGEDPRDVFGIALSDYARMVGTLYAEGYYGPSVSILVDGREAADIDPFAPPAQVDAIAITVEPGARFRFGSVGVAPRAPSATAEPIVEGFETGRPARAGLVGAAANAGIREWRAEGHALAERAGETIVADHPERQLDVAIALAPGRKLRFGQLGISGDTGVRETRIRQIMGFPEGEVFSPDALRAAVNRLQRAGVYRTVSVQAVTPPNPDGTLDYAMTVLERPRRRLGFGAEYSTLDGLSLNGFWLHRNLFGGAERLRIDGEIANIGAEEIGAGDLGGIDYFLGARLTRPGTFGPDNDAFVFAELARDDEEEYEEDSFTAAAGLRRYFSETFFAEAAAGLRYSDVIDAFGEREFYHVIVPTRLQWDRRDEPGDARQGFFLAVEAMPYAGLDTTSQSGGRGYMDARAYLGVGAEKGTVFAARLQAGSVVGSDIDATPQDFLFYSGGGGTVRGQTFESLGVTLEDGRQTGGRSFLGLQTELRQRVTDAIGVVAFFDIGYVGAESYIDVDAEDQSGVGLGVRYATPIGPVRVDVATPYSESDDRFERFELYIGVGQAF